MHGMRRAEESGIYNDIVECEYPSLQIYAVEIADPQPPVTLKAVEEGLAGFVSVIYND